MKKVIFLLYSFVLASCSKEIPFDFDKSNRTIVIEGNINDIDSFSVVKLSHTINLSAENENTVVEGATITLSDLTLGKSSLLTEYTPGMYKTNNIKGIPGHEYSLKVNASGKTYEAKSEMPIPVYIDSMNFLDMSTFYQKGYNPILYYQDPGVIINYYRYVISVDGVNKKSNYATNDQYFDGKYVNFELYKSPVYLNNLVKIEMQCIDKNVFKYFNQISDVDQSGQETISPSNPISNFSGGALGYFSAYTSQSLEGIVR